MKHHYQPEELKLYAARQMSKDEMIRLIKHLENCLECADTVCKHLLRDESETLSLFFDEVLFHLEYEDHLQPFVDSQADDSTCEIVETHTRMCADCAFQLRELREFSESMRFRNNEQNSAVTAPAQINVRLCRIESNTDSKFENPYYFDKK